MVVLHLVQHSLQLWNLLNANLKRKNNEAVIIVKFKQKLLMTPKLQQSINILQLSAHELGELIEKEYMENPTLEIDSSSEHELEPASNFDKTMDFLEYLNKDDEKPEPVANDDDFKVKEFTRNNQTFRRIFIRTSGFYF